MPKMLSRFKAATARCKEALGDAAKKETASDLNGSNSLTGKELLTSVLGKRDRTELYTA